MNVEEFMPNDLDVQKAVVESLAADKAEQDIELESLRKENAQLKSEISTLKKKIEEMKAALADVGDVLAKNTEVSPSSKVALLERDPEINDRFLGETHDQVIEVIKEAREAAEKFADDSGSRLGNIQKATQGLFSIEDRDQYTPHIKTVRVVTMVDYALN